MDIEAASVEDVPIDMQYFLQFFMYINYAIQASAVIGLLAWLGHWLYVEYKDRESVRLEDAETLAVANAAAVAANGSLGDQGATELSELDRALGMKDVGLSDQLLNLHDRVRMGNNDGDFQSNLLEKKKD